MHTKNMMRRGIAAVGSALLTVLTGRASRHSVKTNPSTFLTKKPGAPLPPHCCSPSKSTFRRRDAARKVASRPMLQELLESRINKLPDQPGYVPESTIPPSTPPPFQCAMRIKKQKASRTLRQMWPYHRSKKPRAVARKPEGNEMDVDDAAAAPQLVPSLIETSELEDVDMQHVDALESLASTSTAASSSAPTPAPTVSYSASLPSVGLGFAKWSSDDSGFAGFPSAASQLTDPNPMDIEAFPLDTSVWDDDVEMSNDVPQSPGSTSSGVSSAAMSSAGASSFVGSSSFSSAATSSYFSSWTSRPKGGFGGSGYSFTRSSFDGHSSTSAGTYAGLYDDEDVEMEGGASTAGPPPAVKWSAGSQPPPQASSPRPTAAQPVTAPVFTTPRPPVAVPIAAQSTATYMTPPTSTTTPIAAHQYTVASSPVAKAPVATETRTSLYGNDASSAKPIPAKPAAGAAKNKEEMSDKTKGKQEMVIDDSDEFDDDDLPDAQAVDAAFKAALEAKGISEDEMASQAKAAHTAFRASRSDSSAPPAAPAASSSPAPPSSSASASAGPSTTASISTTPTTLPSTFTPPSSSSSASASAAAGRNGPKHLALPSWFYDVQGNLIKPVTPPAPAHISPEHYAPSRSFLLPDGKLDLKAKELWPPLTGAEIKQLLDEGKWKKSPPTGDIYWRPVGEKAFNRPNRYIKFAKLSTRASLPYAYPDWAALWTLVGKGWYTKEEEQFVASIWEQRQNLLKEWFESAGTALTNTMAERGTIDPLTLIGKQVYEPVKPAFHHDLIALYGIKAIRESVARFNPTTGEKINRLRKSYANYPAKLGLAGKNKQVVHDDTMGASMSFLTRIEEDEYMSQQNGKSVLKTGFAGIVGDARYKTAEGLAEKLSAAMLFVKEPLDEKVEAAWGEALGHEKPRANKKPQAFKKVAGPSPAISRPTTSAAPTRVSTTKPSTPATNRPQRKTAGIKRGYEDEVGDDDRLYHDGASEGDTSDGGSLSQQHKKQKRVSSNNAPLPPPSSYNPASIHQRH